MTFSQQEHWSGLPFPPPGHLPLPGTEPTSPASPVSPALRADSLPLETKCWQSKCDVLESESNQALSIGDEDWKVWRLRKKRPERILLSHCSLERGRWWRNRNLADQWEGGELLVASASGLWGFVCILFILRMLPLFLMIISLAPGHSYHLFTYYLHWKSTYLFKRQGAI